jgi:predicted dehydrogenase
MVHENFRFQPWHREIKRLLSQDAIGDTLFSISARLRMGDGWQADAYLARQPYFRGLRRFLVYETGIHFIDVFRYLGGEVTSVFARLRRLNPDIAGEDAGVMLFELASGAQAMWDANRYNEPPTGEDPRFTFGHFLIEADRGSIRLGADGRLTVQRLGQVEKEHAYPMPSTGFAGDCVLATQRHFVSGLRDGSRFETDGQQYLVNLEVQEAVYQSAREGLPVRVVA